MKTFRGFAASFSQGSRERQLRCQLSTNNLPPLEFIASFDDRWNVILSGSPITIAQNALIKELCSRNQTLSDLEARCRVGEFTVDQHKQIIEFTVAVTLPDENPFLYRDIEAEWHSHFSNT